MADRDWYDKNIRKNWRGVARRIEKGSDPAQIGELALTALAKTLRESAGVPGLDEIIECARDGGEGETIRAEEWK